MLLSTEGVFYYFDFYIFRHCEELLTSWEFTTCTYIFFDLCTFNLCFRCFIENLKIGMPRITQVNSQPTGLLPLFVIKWT